jgi:hypothetical protein
VAHHPACLERCFQGTFREVLGKTMPTSFRRRCVTRTQGSLLWLMLLGCWNGCTDEHDDNAQLIEGASVPPQAFESNSNLEVLPLDGATCGGTREPGFELYRDADSFRDAYLRARPGAAQVPSVDFERYVVVGAFLVLEASCGVKIELAGALNLEQQVSVDVHITRPAACGTTDALAYPFAFARLNRLDKPYVNVERADTKPCP